MIPKELIRLLNSGRCIALVGSGPSIAMGYPSWKTLSEAAEGAVAASKRDSYDPTDFKPLREASRLPELFELAAEQLGGLTRLLDVLRPRLAPRVGNGRVYEYLARWPFRWYMTTNWDNEIVHHLARIGLHFTSLTNSRADMLGLNDQTTQVVVHLHGTLASPNGLVLTEAQYQDFKVGDDRTYYREKLKALLSTLPVFVVGHSLVDPDLSLILEYGKLISAPGRPIYMILADAPKADIRLFQRKYNIQVVSYDNPDGSHLQLSARLRMIDRFVVPRSGELAPLDLPDAREVEVASSLLLFSKLALGTGSGSLARRAIEPQVLRALCAAHPNGCREPELLSRIIPRAVAQHPDTASHVTACVTTLCAGRLAVRDEDLVRGTQAGLDRCAEVDTDRRVLEDQVYGALEAHLRSSTPPLDDAVIGELVGCLKHSLIAALRRRGLATSTLLFERREFERGDMAEVFEAVTSGVARVPDYPARTAYVDFVMDLLTKPTEPQKRYLASISQGFFAFHLFGQDPDGRKAREALAANVAWVCDSNVLLPLLARECHSHAFVMDAMARMRSLGIEPTTTTRFIEEAQAAFDWAHDNCMSDGTGSVESVYDVTQRLDYYENLFIDGFIRGAQLGKWNTFKDYTKQLRCGTQEATTRALNTLGIGVRDPEHHSGHVSGDGASIRELTAAIWDERIQRGSSRGGERQARAEAEALHIIKCLRDGHYRLSPQPRSAYFLSTSRLLDQMFPDVGLISWNPESLYRHLSFLGPDGTDAEKLFESMAMSYYSMNINVIDDSTYAAVFGSIINASKLDFEREKDNYLASVENEVRTRAEFEEMFARTPDIEKPLFVGQMAWALAREQEGKRADAEARARELERELERARSGENVARDRRLVAAEGRAAVLAAELATTRREAKEALARQREELEQKQVDRDRQEEARIRHLKDPAHLRKRRRQAKKRSKK